jgi:hypothetical protein
MEKNTRKYHELYDLCHAVKKDDMVSYDKLRCWLDSHVEDKKILETAVSYKDNDNRTPLHLILKKNPPADMVERLIDISPQIIHLKNRYYGMLPIHYACMGGASEEVVQRLIRASPETVQIKDSSGWLPLHYACRYKASLKVLNDLITIYPESVYIKTNKSETAAQLLRAKSERCGESIGVKLLQQACASGCFSVNLMRLLLDAYGSPSSSSTSCFSSTSSNYSNKNDSNDHCISEAASVSTSSCSVTRPINEVAPLLQTTQSTESDSDMTMSSNDAITHVTQELLQLKPDIIMEMTVMNSELLKEIARSKSEIKELKTDMKAIKTEIADIHCNVTVIKDMLQKLLYLLE